MGGQNWQSSPSPCLTDKCQRPTDLTNLRGVFGSWYFNVGKALGQRHRVWTYHWFGMLIHFSFCDPATFVPAASKGVCVLLLIVTTAKHRVGVRGLSHLYALLHSTIWYTVTLLHSVTLYNRIHCNIISTVRCSIPTTTRIPSNPIQSNPTTYRFGCSKPF